MTNAPLRKKAEALFRSAPHRIANSPLARRAKALSRRAMRILQILGFWRAMGILLFIGFGSWALNAIFLPADSTGWFRLQPDMTSWTGWPFGIGVWLGAGALCAVVLKSILNAQDFLKALAAMWRPVVILAAAGYLLFFNDQGRELGHSLLGQHDLPPIVFLFVALVYWAANTWHSARLGIHRHLENGVLGVAPSHPSQLSKTSPNRHVLRGDEPWLYWPPRLLGVCAHLFAAISLSLAAWNIPFAAPPSVFGLDVPQSALQWLTRNTSFAIALSAPLAIVLATAFVWAEDVTCSRRGKGFASAKKVAIARRVSWAAIVGLLAVLAGLAYVALDTDRIPQGFLPGTICIVLSAMVFLGLISWLRNLTPPLGADASARGKGGGRRSTAQADQGLYRRSVRSRLSRRSRRLDVSSLVRGSGLDGRRLFRLRRDPRARQCDRVDGRVRQWAHDHEAMVSESGRRPLEPSARAWSRLRSSSASSMRGCIRSIGCGFVTALASRRFRRTQRPTVGCCSAGLVCASERRLQGQRPCADADRRDGRRRDPRRLLDGDGSREARG